MSEEDPEPMEEDTLAAVAAAAADRSPPAPRTPPAPPAKLPIGWRVFIFFMHAWAAGLLGAGLLCVVGAGFIWLNGAQAFEVERHNCRVTVSGWGFCLCLAAVMFIGSKLQSRMANKLRAKKLAALKAEHKPPNTVL